MKQKRNPAVHCTRLVGPELLPIACAILSDVRDDANRLRKALASAIVNNPKARKRKRAAAVACTDLLAHLDWLRGQASLLARTAKKLETAGFIRDSEYTKGVARGLRSAVHDVSQIMRANAAGQGRRDQGGKT